jgi:tRNA U38,U39,U40 pseudouridine synthase TruA
MMAILFLIGKSEEDEDIIEYLFDVEQVKERPSYAIASEKGLILSSCGYDDIKWENALISDVETYKVIKH